MKRAFKKIIIIVLLFVISFFCVRHWFTIQSENLWASTKESLSSKGVSFNLKDIIPPKVLDRENFALADFFRAENEEFLKKPSSKNEKENKKRIEGIAYMFKKYNRLFLLVSFPLKMKRFLYCHLKFQENFRLVAYRPIIYL